MNITAWVLVALIYGADHPVSHIYFYSKDACMSAKKELEKVNARHYREQFYCFSTIDK